MGAALVDVCGDCGNSGGPRTSIQSDNRPARIGLVIHPPGSAHFDVEIGGGPGDQDKPC